eukprot:COSAG02_NODE_4533_length_5248_cov_2.069528_2_plen_153_part_00
MLYAVYHLLSVPADQFAMVCVQSFAKAAAEAAAAEAAAAEAATAAEAAAEEEEAPADAEAEAEAEAESTGGEAGPTAASVYGALKDGMAAVRAAVEVRALSDPSPLSRSGLLSRAITEFVHVWMGRRIHRRARYHLNLNQLQKPKSEMNGHR